MKIVKKGIERKYYSGRGTSLKGCVLCNGLSGEPGELFYITDVWRDIDGQTVVNAVWVSEETGAALSLLTRVYDGDIIAPGAIVDAEGMELTKIKVTKFL